MPRHSGRHVEIASKYVCVCRYTLLGNTLQAPVTECDSIKISVGRNDLPRRTASTRQYVG